ncbi:MAG: hypothetical protein WC795_02970 [Candidatus Paceibacterota bacterium]|jgi:hypothetical protein
MAKEKMYRWFIYPMDGEHTNKVLSNPQHNNTFFEGLSATDQAQRIPVWECSREFLTQFENGRKGNGVKYRVYVQESKYGKLKPYPFAKNLGKKKKPGADLVKKALEMKNQK